MSTGLGVALMSGLFAGTVSCALPLYPAMLNHLTRARENPRTVALFFTFGLAGVYFLMYVIFGFLTAFLGMQFFETVELWRGRLLIFGTLFSWLMAWRTIRGNMSGRVIKLLNVDVEGGYLGALVSGFIYGTMVTPCNAPFLVTGILPALASKTSVFEGLALIFVFSIAFGAPILVLGWASSFAISTFKVLQKNTRKLELLSAIFLIIAGFYFLYLFLLTLY